MKAFKAFIKYFEVPQRSVKIKIWLIFLSFSEIVMGRVNSWKLQTIFQKTRQNVWGGSKYAPVNEKADQLRENTKQILHKKWSFPLRISSVNVTKSAANCGFDHIYWRNPKWKTSFFVQWEVNCLPQCSKQRFPDSFV